MNNVINYSFFEGFSTDQLNRLLTSAELIEFKKDTVFIKEGVSENIFYYIQQGSVKVFTHSSKRDYLITTLYAGNTVGELALIDPSPRSASVKTIEDSCIYKFDIKNLESDPELQEILTIIKQKISNQLSGRLRLTNNITVSALEKRYVMSIFSVRMLILLSLYTLSLNIIEASQRYFQSRTLISVGLILVFVFVLFSIVRSSGYPLSFYGFRADNLYKNILEAILYSIPVMLLILIGKWLAIFMEPAFNHIPLFDPSSIFKNGATFTLRIYLLSLLLYALFCPVQEFLVRGCVQTSLQTLFEGSPGQIKWKSIIVSNLIFASAHSHTSTEFALMAFLPGLFWGWMFYRQKSLIGVSISHIIIGVWAVFIVGIEKVI